MDKLNSCTLLIVERAVRDWLRIFNWPESVMEIGNDLYSLIYNSKELFKEEVGCYDQGKIGLMINLNAVNWCIIFN